MITNKDAKEFHKMIKKLEEQNRFKKEQQELDESYKQSKLNKKERVKDIINTLTSSDKKADLVNTILERKRKEMHDKEK